MMAMSRDVIEALNEELAHQAIGNSSECVAVEADGVSGQPFSFCVPCLLVTLATHVRRAQDAQTENASETPALHELRIIAAIAIRALELLRVPAP